MSSIGLHQRDNDRCCAHWRDCVTSKFGVGVEMMRKIGRPDYILDWDRAQEFAAANWLGGDVGGRARNTSFADGEIFDGRALDSIPPTHQTSPERGWLEVLGAGKII